MGLLLQLDVCLSVFQRGPLPALAAVHPPKAMRASYPPVVQALACTCKHACVTAAVPLRTSCVHTWGSQPLAHAHMPAGARYEAALYGALCAYLPATLAVCNTWEDTCWAYCRWARQGVLCRCYGVTRYKATG